MKLSLEDLHRVSNWFEIACQHEDLRDDDLVIHDRIVEYLEEKGVIGAPGDLIDYLDEDLNEDNDDLEDKEYGKLDFYDEHEEDEDRY